MISMSMSGLCMNFRLIEKCYHLPWDTDRFIWELMNFFLNALYSALHVAGATSTCRKKIHWNPSSYHIQPSSNRTWPMSDCSSWIPHFRRFTKVDILSFWCKKSSTFEPQSELAIERKRSKEGGVRARHRFQQSPLLLSSPRVTTKLSRSNHQRPLQPQPMASSKSSTSSSLINFSSLLLLRLVMSPNQIGLLWNPECK